MGQLHKYKKRLSHHSIRYTAKMVAVQKVIWIDDLPTVEEFNENRAYYKRLISKAVDKLFKEKSGHAISNAPLTKWLSEPSRPKRIKRAVM